MADNSAVASELYVAFVRLIRDLRRETPHGGVAASGLSALYTLARTGPVRATALAEVEGVMPASMTRIVDRLCELDLAVRLPDPADGRAQLVSLTDAGRRTVEEGKGARLDAVRRRIDALAPEDQAALAELAPVLTRMVEGGASDTDS